MPTIPALIAMSAIASQVSDWGSETELAGTAAGSFGASLALWAGASFLACLRLCLRALCRLGGAWDSVVVVVLVGVVVVVFEELVSGAVEGAGAEFDGAGLDSDFFFGVVEVSPGTLSTYS